MPQTPDIERAARQAADEVYAQLLVMFATNQLGEVAAVLGPNELNVERRPRTKTRTIKLRLGHWSAIEKVVQT